MGLQPRRDDPGGRREGLNWGFGHQEFATGWFAASHDEN